MAGKLTNLSILEKEIEDKLPLAFLSEGVLVLDSILTPEEILLFQKEIYAERNSFKPAKVGKGSRSALDSEIRRDQTAWWNFSCLTEAQSLLTPLFSRIKEVCNRELYLGLSEIEGHYAIYEPGAFYRRHLDRFQNTNQRTLSVVLFFNSDWSVEDRGQLALKDKKGDERKLLPIGGRLVLFLSANIPHEVLETRKERLSFAGWFKTN